MAEKFDAYYEWLAIPPEDQPPDLYRLLAIRTFEDKPSVIESAADQRMVHLRTFQSGRHSDESQKLLNEVAAARLVLLNPTKKADYDVKLRELMRQRAAGEQESEELSSELATFLRQMDEPDVAAQTPSAQTKPARRTLPKATPLDTDEASESTGDRLGAMFDSIKAEDRAATPSKRAKEAGGPSRKTILIAAGVGAAVLLLAIFGVWATRSGDDKEPTVASEKKDDQAPAPPPPPSVPSEPSPEPPTEPVQSNPENRTLGNLLDEDKPEEIAQVGTTEPEAVTEPAGPSLEPPVPSPAAPSESVQQRLPVPSAAEQAKIAALIDSTYDPDNIAKPSEKLELAGRLLELAKKPGDNATERFVLLRKATELARDGGDAGLMLSAINVMGKQFEIAPLNVKGKLLLQFAEDARDKAAISSLAENIAGPINEALAAGRPDAAYAIIDAAYNAVMRVRATEHRKSLHEKREAVSKLYQPWLRNRQALAALEKNPDHPEANLAAGRYACFTEGKWDEGLSMLAKGSDPTLQAVAKQELANPTDPLPQVALADAWWAAAESESKDIQPILKQHAADWYQRALPAVTSVVVKDKCTQRLGEVARLASAAPQFVTQTRPALPTQADATSRGRAPALAVAPFDAERGKQYQEGWARYLKLPPELSLDLRDGVKIEFVLIPPGEFVMGSPEAERQVALAQATVGWAKERIPTEGPQHKIKISQPFYLGKYEVTQAQWQAVTGSNPSRFKDPMNPVEQLSWDDIQPFLAKLNIAFEGKGMLFDLPTEAQWEYACRAGTTTAFSVGDDLALLSQCAWVKANSGGRARPVGQGQPNAWGLYDMHGNVREWCSDCYGADYYAKSPPADPTGPPTGSHRVHRGGCWDHPPRLCRAAFRHHDPPGYRYGDLGFRLALVLAGRTPEPARKPTSRRTTVSKQPKELTIDVPGGVKMEFVLIPAGEFMMGSSEAERQIALVQETDGWAKERIPTEGPQHNVKITQRFYLGKYEVTQAQWQAVMGNNPSRFKDPMHPVKQVSWDDIQPFLAKLNAAFQKKGMLFRLPTEAEWEYACRAGTTTAFYFGDNPALLAQHGWFKDNSGGKTHPVGQGQPNPWGLYDMHGNVWEWCSDWYGADYYAKSPPADPTGPPTGSHRVYRGGGWSSPARHCRAAFRDHFNPGDRHFHLGLGCRLSLVLVDARSK